MEFTKEEIKKYELDTYPINPYTGRIISSYKKIGSDSMKELMEAYKDDETVTSSKSEEIIKDFVNNKIEAIKPVDILELFCTRYNKKYKLYRILDLNIESLSKFKKFLNTVGDNKEVFSNTLSSYTIFHKEIPEVEGLARIILEYNFEYTDLLMDCEDIKDYEELVIILPGKYKAKVINEIDIKKVNQAYDFLYKFNENLPIKNGKIGSINILYEDCVLILMIDRISIRMTLRISMNGEINIYVYGSCLQKHKNETLSLKLNTQTIELKLKGKNFNNSIKVENIHKFIKDNLNKLENINI